MYTHLIFTCLDIFTKSMEPRIHTDSQTKCCFHKMNERVCFGYRRLFVDVYEWFRLHTWILNVRLACKERCLKHFCKQVTIKKCVLWLIFIMGFSIFSTTTMILISGSFFPFVSLSRALTVMQKGRVQKVVLCCFLINIVIHLCTPVSGSGDQNKGNQSLWFYSCPWEWYRLKGCMCHRCAGLW